MPRGQWKAPGIWPSRSSSRTSRRSTKSTSGRPCLARASSRLSVLMRDFASSTICRKPFRSAIVSVLLLRSMPCLRARVLVFLGDGAMLKSSIGCDAGCEPVEQPLMRRIRRGQMPSSSLASGHPLDAVVNWLNSLSTNPSPPTADQPRPAPSRPSDPPAAAPGEPSLEDVVRVLCAARRFFGVAGTAFLLWKIDEVVRKNQKRTVGGALMEVALVSVLGPGLVWVTSQWGERLAKEASRHHDELVRLHERAQQEIAERKRAEGALAEANARLEARVAERTRELTRLNEALRREMSERRRAQSALVEQEKLAATGRMAAQMAHEINNPLAGIKSAYRVIRDAIPTDHQDARFVGLIDKEIDRIARIVHQTLDLYRPHPEPPRRFRIDRAVQEVAILLEAPCRARGVALTVEPTPAIEAWLPEGPVHQVLFNLLENALEASPRDGHVRVAVTA